MSTFQIIVLGVCAALILIGVGVFASFGGLGNEDTVGDVTIWGTVDSSIMDRLISTMLSGDKAFSGVDYVEKSPTTYHADIVNAMATGKAPDLVFLSQEEIGIFEDKLLIIPYGMVSQATFLSSFIDESQVFLTDEGELALPFMVDPVVMYWNRDLFSSAGVASPPKFWNDFLTLAPKMTSLDAGANITKSAVGLGQWQNVANAKAILSTLFMQAGDKVVVRKGSGDLEVVLGDVPTNAPSNPAESALRFYTEFTNPSKTTYSWNRTLPLSTTAFVAGDVAVYFGFASEYPSLAARNPNLPFAVARVPQVEGSSIRATYGRLTGMVIPRNASNPNGAAQIAQRLSSAESVSTLSALTGLPPVRRDVTIKTSDNAAMGVFVESALIARGWVDPDSTKTDAIFRTMIESVVSGRLDSGGAVNEASRAMEQLLKK
ncbi:MAG: extracellular solute-binding protein [Candidatus Pacebacteria bacterium]|nr:extracellular solute-binding protein [Candidatus Paceibacterota bacterium]